MQIGRRLGVPHAPCPVPEGTSALRLCGASRQRTGFRAAQAEHARLIIDNLKGRSCADVGRIADAGGRQVTFGDIHRI